MGVHEFVGRNLNKASAYMDVFISGFRHADDPQGGARKVLACCQHHAKEWFELGARESVVEEAWHHAVIKSMVFMYAFHM